jgi:hypothetical protein
MKQAWRRLSACRLAMLAAMRRFDVNLPFRAAQQW